VRQRCLHAIAIGSDQAQAKSFGDSIARSNDTLIFMIFDVCCNGMGNAPQSCVTADAEARRDPGTEMGFWSRRFENLSKLGVSIVAEAPLRRNEGLRRLVMFDHDPRLRLGHRHSCGAPLPVAPLPVVMLNVCAGSIRSHWPGDSHSALMLTRLDGVSK
jgi:hypothetical protein